jgi:DNA-binding PucR family transcriptional regulator
MSRLTRATTVVSQAVKFSTALVLTAVLAEDGALIPENTRSVLADPSMHATIEAFMQADMNIAVAASVLCLHPNSLRYRLRRIAEKTGRDPHKLADLLELIAAGRVMASVASTAQMS